MAMALPFFYTRFDVIPSKEVTLDEDASRHIVQVLRMKEGDQLLLTDGKGNRFTTAISDANKKRCRVFITNSEYITPVLPKTIIGISLVKNNSRFEWFLEKATEIGISSIVPIICKRTEKDKFRFDRMHNILVSAMQQSMQCWLPVLHQPVNFELLFAMEDIVNAGQKFIAHCMEGDKPQLYEALAKSDTSRVLLIGPEGDFTEEEVQFALQNKFNPISLGNTRLRTETAGLVGAVMLKGG